MRGSRAARIGIALACGLAVSVLIYFLAEGIGASTLASRPATCTATACFCEAPTGGFPMQLAGSFSSLGFVFLGCWALLVPGRLPVGVRERRLIPIFGVVLILIGTGSFVYHSTLSFFGQFLDIFSMYLFGTLLALGALYRAGRLGPRAAASLFVVMNVVLAVVQYQVPDARRVLFAAILLPGLILELTPWITGHSPRSPRVRFMYVGVGLLVVAYVIWTLDQWAPFCSPASLVQGHAIWHLLSALSAVMIVAHYRRTAHAPSEVAGPRDRPLR